MAVTVRDRAQRRDVGSGPGSNYTITYVNGTLTVNPAALTITANNASKTYGRRRPSPAPRSPTTGLVNGDTITGVTETSTGAAATATVAGHRMPSCPAPRWAAGLGNYTITYVNGTLTVNPAALTITANNASKTYGQTATFAGTAFTDNRPGQRRHGHQRDRDQHRRGGNGRRWPAHRIRSSPAPRRWHGSGATTRSPTSTAR